MRIVKLGRKEFSTLNDVQRFFESELHSSRRNGNFNIPPRWISRDGLRPNELLLFSYCGNVYYRARAATGLERHTKPPDQDHPFYFRIDLSTLDPVPAVPLADVQARLKKTRAYHGNVVSSRRWPLVRENSSVKKLWSSLDGARRRKRLIGRKYGGGGEGRDHKQLKNWLANNPDQLDLCNVRKVSVEHPFLSGDVVDILFELTNGTDFVVEVETTTPLPGCHQAIKYRALRCAQRGLALNSRKVLAIVVAWDIPSDVASFCQFYGIIHFNRHPK